LGVTPATLTVTAPSPAVNYGTALPAITPSYSGFQYTDGASSLTTAPTCTSTATSSTPAAGPYTTSCSGGASANYTFNYVNGTATVNAVGLTITASSPTVTYGSPAPTITAGYSGFVNGDGSSSLSTQPTCVTAATASSPVGGYSTSCSGAVDTNYSISYVNGSETVSPAALVATASSPTTTYGTALPAITASYSGFENGDSASSLATQPTCKSSATSSTPPVGSYPTSCTGAVDTNYTITYVNGLATVKPAALVITASSATVVFGSPGPPKKAE
jgi:hypothetical protein